MGDLFDYPDQFRFQNPFQQPIARLLSDAPQKDISDKPVVRTLKMTDLLLLQHDKDTKGRIEKMMLNSKKV